MSSVNYIDPDRLKEDLTLYCNTFKEKLQQIHSLHPHWEKGTVLRETRKQVQMSRWLAESIEKMAFKICNRSSFKNYTYREEMEREAVITTVANIWKFKPELGFSAFAYMTTIMISSILQVMKREKKQTHIKEAVMSKHLEMLELEPMLKEEILATMDSYNKNTSDWFKEPVSDVPDSETTIVDVVSTLLMEPDEVEETKTPSTSGYKPHKYYRKTSNKNTNTLIDEM